VKTFWRDSYEDWTIYQQFRSRVLIASDVLESIQLQLIYFLHNKEDSDQVTMKWTPFEHNVGQVSNMKLIWHYFCKEKDNNWIVYTYEKDWIKFSLYYLEIGYI